MERQFQHAVRARATLARLGTSVVPRVRGLDEGRFGHCADFSGTGGLGNIPKSFPPDGMTMHNIFASDALEHIRTFDQIDYGARCYADVRPRPQPEVRARLYGGGSPCMPWAADGPCLGVSDPVADIFR